MTHRRGLTVLVVAAVAIALGVWLLTRGDTGSGFDDLAGVQRVDGDVVHLSPDADPAGVAIVVARARDAADRSTTVTLGRASWRADDAATPREVAAALIALGSIDVPGEITVEPGGSPDRVRVELRAGTTPATAATAAAAVVARSSRSLDTVLVDVRNSTLSSEVSLHGLAFDGREPLLRSLRRVAAVSGLQVVDGDGRALDVTVLAPADDPRSSWQATQRLDVRDVTLWVGSRDVSVTGPRGPVPDRALRLAARLRSAGASAHLTTDLSDVIADVASAKAPARILGGLAGDVAASTKLRFEWEDAGTHGMSSMSGDRRSVARVAPALASLSDRYVVGWRQSTGSEPAQLVLTPRHPPGSLFGDRAALRALVEDIRSVEWSGRARFQIIMGAPASSRTTADGKIVAVRCGGQYSTVTITSTRDGRASAAKGACNGSGDLDVAREAWNASAIR